MGLDFGYHWDEKLQFGLVQDSLESGILLPGWYKYPSITYWFSFLGTLPHAVLTWPQVGGNWQALVAHLINVTKTDAYLLQVRTIFLLVSALSLVWVYLQPLTWGRSWLEGLVAAAALGFSWEVAYHARWIAPDSVLMQFGALTILCATLAIRQPQHRFWLYGSALAAGLACSTKYPGGLLVVPALIAAYTVQSVKEQTLRVSDEAKEGEATPQFQALIIRGFHKTIRFLNASFPVVLIFGAAYLAATPGTLLEPIHFYKSITYELSHYSTGLSEQIITPGLPHLGLMLNYLAQVLFSHFRPAAWLIFSLAALGAFALFKKDRSLFALLTIFPACYLLYFSTLAVMRARNLLVLAPFMALLSAHGAIYVWDKLPKAGLRRIWLALLTAVLILNAGWLGYAAWSIQKRDPGRSTAALIEYVSKYPGSHFWASEKVWQQAYKQPGETPNNFSPLPGGDDGYLVFYASEGMHNPNDWPSSRPGMATRIFGPWEVNFDYYPRWAGEDRILVMPLDKAHQIGIQLVR
ncbi:ArnT family glycosyltransferase [Chloroflexota bacterium]